MIALAPLLLIACPAPVQGSAELRVEPAGALLGQPLTWTLAVTHDSARRVDVDFLNLSLDDSWVVTEGPVARVRASGDETLTEVRWTVLSLEPRVAMIPMLAVPFDVGPAETVRGEPFDVRGELAEDEDLPRPLPRFHDVGERTGPVRPRHLGLGVLALVLAGGAWFVARRKRRAELPEPTELERFSGLERGDADDPERARALMYELSALLRAAAERPLERPLDASLAGRSDEEWIAEVRGTERLPRTLMDDLEQLLAECGRVKYARAHPTRFAVDDTLRRAEALLVELSTHEPPAVEPVAEPTEEPDAESAG